MGCEDKVAIHRKVRLEVHARGLDYGSVEDGRCGNL
jgi:hypothetical protein